METIRLSTKGQLVIPHEIRKAHHLTAGTEFIVAFVGNEIRLTPLPPETVGTLAKVAGLLAHRGRHSSSDKRTKIQRTLRARDATTKA